MEPDYKSAEISSDVSYVVARIIVPDFNEIDTTEQQKIVAKLDHPVRKTAHASEYFLLGILASLSLFVWFKKNKIILLFAGFAISVLYAISDEIHQMFVPGRAGMFTDVLIDAAGAMTGVILLLIIILIRGKVRSDS